MIRAARIWWLCRRLERLTAERRAKFAAEHPDFARRRKAGKLGWQRRGLA